MLHAHLGIDFTFVSCGDRQTSLSSEPREITNNTDEGKHPNDGQNRMNPCGDEVEGHSFVDRIYDSFCMQTLRTNEKYRKFLTVLNP